jgi:hypothetical protein
MKTLLFVSLILLACASALGQDVNAFPTGRTYSDTLTADVDTIDINFAIDIMGITQYMISAFTTTGTDTVDVYVLSFDGNMWSKEALVDFSSGSDVTQIIITTTPKTFGMVDYEVPKLRLLTNDSTASTVFNVQGKKLRYSPVR